jgi:arylformamidase
VRSGWGYFNIFDSMKLSLDNNRYILTEKGIDISLPLSNDPKSVLAWYCEPIKIEPVVTDTFIGEVKQGGSVNFRNVTLNLHGNGTHTECVGHISKEEYSLNQCLKEFHFMAQLISVEPVRKLNKTYQTTEPMIDRNLLEAHTINKGTKALVIRTLQNPEEKKHHNYSNTNPPYLTKEAVEFINECGIDHLLIDLPSVDREVDGGRLEAHHTFWNYSKNSSKDPGTKVPSVEGYREDEGNKGIQTHKTITELVYIPDHIPDGQYLLNIQITSLETDASPSKIMLYEILQEV